MPQSPQIPRILTRYGSEQTSMLGDSGDEHDQAVVDQLMSEHILEQSLKEGQDADDEGGPGSPQVPGAPPRVISTSRVGAQPHN